MSKQAVIEQAELLPAKAAEPPPPAQSAAIIQVIERAALNPEIDVEKMERLLAMQERILDREAEQAFNEAMKAAQEEMPQVVRDAHNPQTKSRYARLETVSKAINPVITKHGFSMSFGTADSTLENHYRVVCTVSHTGGHSREYHADVPADTVGMKGNLNKTATHGFGSTMSYGRRYLKLLIFDVALTNEDDDGNRADSGEPITDEQVEELITLADDVGADKAKFCAYFKIESFAAIPAKHFQRAKDALEAKRTKA